MRITALVTELTRFVLLLLDTGLRVVILAFERPCCIFLARRTYLPSSRRRSQMPETQSDIWQVVFFGDARYRRGHVMFAPLPWESPPPYTSGGDRNLATWQASVQGIAGLNPSIVFSMCFRTAAARNL